MREVYDFLTQCGVFYLATTEGDQPRVRPFGALCIFEDRLYIQTGRVKPVSHQLAANPKAEVCAFQDGVWLRVAATLVEDARIEAQQAMLDANPGLKNRYQAGDGNTQVFYFKDATATFSSFTAAPEVVRF